MAFEILDTQVKYDLVELFIYSIPGQLTPAHMAVSEDWPVDSPVVSPKNGTEGLDWSRDFAEARQIALQKCDLLGLNPDRIPESAEIMRKASIIDYSKFNLASEEGT